MHVHVALWKRYGDALGVEAQLDALRDIPLQSPIIFGLDPRPGGNAHAAIVQRLHKDYRRRIGQHPWVDGQDLAQHLFRFAQVVGIAHAEDKIHAQAALARIVEQIVALNLGVGDGMVISLLSPVTSTVAKS